MNHIKAIGFDLFNTLVIAELQTLGEAMSRLSKSLRQSGFKLENEQFKEAYREAALEFVKKAQKDGIETHNRFWISAALQSQGYDISPDDARIAIAVDNYFSAFFLHCHLIPDTKQMLSSLRDRYRLGLLTNFTHGPAAREIIDKLGLNLFFDVVLISGELGFRKPHTFVFHRLIEHLGVRNDQAIYIGDDLEPDIKGAQRAGLQPVLTTYVRDQNIPSLPGIVYSDIEEIDCEVPQISTWKDLLSLLGRE
jgi:putative hydrolase of the HAD superfamily